VLAVYASAGYRHDGSIRESDLGGAHYALRLVTPWVSSGARRPAPGSGSGEAGD
jgi:hypothetical protein